jgi:hypothetical protein
LIPMIEHLLAPVEYLDSYATACGQKEPDGHPNPQGYLGWTRKFLIPYLTNIGILNKV